jgi:hypothetical protein
MRRLLDKDEELKASDGKKVEQRAKDAATFERRNDIYTQNANMFISNNANPFLISPYGPPANLISKQLLAQLSTIVSTLAYSLSTIIDINTFTIRISTIRPVAGQSTITLNTNTLNINAAPTFGPPPVPSMNVSISSFFSTINTNYLTVNSTLTVSTIAGTANFNTLQGTTLVASTFNTSTIIASTITTSTLFTSTLNTSSIVASTLTTSSITASTMYLQSTLIVASTIRTSTIIASTIVAATDVTTNSTIFPQYTILGTAVAGFTPVNPSQGAIRIDVGGTFYRIPYYT